MSSRSQIRYRYEGIEEWEQSQQALHEIIQKDTGEENWIETKSLPPFGVPPPMTREAIDKLKALKGVKIEEVKE